LSRSLVFSFNQLCPISALGEMITSGASPFLSPFPSIFLFPPISGKDAKALIDVRSLFTIALLSINEVVLPRNLARERFERANQISNAHVTDLNATDCSHD